MEFEVEKESKYEVHLSIKFVGGKAYEILRGVLKGKFDINLSLFECEGCELHNFIYNSMVLEEVYGLSFSATSCPEVPSFTARFTKCMSDRTLID